MVKVGNCFDNWELENMVPKTLCVFLLDNSGSMSGKKIDDLNKGLQQFYQDIHEDEAWSRRIEVAIISFETDVHYLQQPSIVENFTMPTLTAMGGTNMVGGIQKAIEVVEKRKKYYREKGILYKRPWIIMITDGFADVDSIKDQVKKDQENKRYYFQPFAIDEGSDLNVLNSLVNWNVLSFKEMSTISFLKKVSIGVRSSFEDVFGTCTECNNISEAIGEEYKEWNCFQI